MRLRHLLLPLLAAPLLTACVNDGASYEIDNTREHVLSLIREQPYFWQKQANFSLVVARMPACMRRHSLGSAPIDARVEVYRVPSGAFIVKIGRRMYATETQTCESFAQLDAEPLEGMGQLVGIFRVKGGALVFDKAAGDTPAAQ